MVLASMQKRILKWLTFSELNRNSFAMPFFRSRRIFSRAGLIAVSARCEMVTAFRIAILVDRMSVASHFPLGDILLYFASNQSLYSKQAPSSIATGRKNIASAVFP